MGNDLQIIYILTNSSMPELIKVGRTSRDNVDERMKELYSTGVPVPFECYYACQVDNASEVEKSIHFAFNHHRVNPNREFFNIEPEKIYRIIKLLQVKEVTSDINNEIKSEVNSIEIDSSHRLFNYSRRPTLRFSTIGIPKGSVLSFRNDEKITITVFDDKKVDFNGEVLSLTMATRKLLGKPEDYPLQPSPYWYFNGRALIDIYESFYSEDE